MRNRILSYDSTFGLAPTAALTLHLSRFDAEGKFAETMTGTVPSRPACATFDDTQHLLVRLGRAHHAVNGVHPGRYQPGWYSVDVPKTGTTITVVEPGQEGQPAQPPVN